MLFTGAGALGGTAFSMSICAGAGFDAGGVGSALATVGVDGAAAADGIASIG
ncbi:MAG: hypothetical protein SXG53_12810 [Pseudomonadota bacterium]|nr:hypothetical protein [Pseudomonadota bacterium]